MSAVKIWLTCIFWCFAPTVLAENMPSACQGSEEFLPYKAGIQAEKEGLTTEAFTVFCHLALQGDYRAQFKLANYYFNGIPDLIEPDHEFAYIWAGLSNHYAVSKKKTEFSNKLFQLIAEEKRPQLQAKLENALTIIPTGARIDIQYAPLDYAKIFKEIKEKNEKKRFTGSRIKRDEPILNTRIFDL